METYSNYMELCSSSLDIHRNSAQKRLSVRLNTYSHSIFKSHCLSCYNQLEVLSSHHQRETVSKAIDILNTGTLATVASQLFSIKYLSE